MSMFPASLPAANYNNRPSALHYPAVQAPLPSSVPGPSIAPGSTSLRIVYNNDPHEKFKALPHLTSAFRYFTHQGRALGKDILRLSGGDNNVGKEPDEWALNVRMMNLLKYHAAALGNHELDTGSRSFAEGLRHATFPTIVSNLDIKPGSAISQRVQEGQIRTEATIVRGDRGESYGVIGVTTPELEHVLSSSAKLEGEEVEEWDDTVEIVQAQVQQLQRQGINRIIVVSHMGLELDKRLAESVSGIDVIVGGHSHDILPGITPGINYLRSRSGEPVLILQAGKNAQYMGVADVLFDPMGRVIPQQNILYNPFAMPADPLATAIRDAGLGKPKPLATITTPYDCNGNEYHADPVAQFTADAMRAASGADIAFVRSPETRSNIDPGTFTDHDLKALMPFTDPVVKLSVTGQELLVALQKSAEGLRTKNPHPGMLHPSGMAISMNRKTGQVTQAYVYNRAARQWEMLNPKKSYTIALGEFTVKGKEFPSLAHPERLSWNAGQPVRAFFAWGLQQSGAPYRPIAFRDDGRLQIS